MAVENFTVSKVTITIITTKNYLRKIMLSIEQKSSPDAVTQT